MTRTAHAPFPEDARTGRALISPCCTASVREFRINGALWLAGHVAGHGWLEPCQGRVVSVNVVEIGV